MGQTFYFLTATWLAAQGAGSQDIWTRDASPCGCQRSSSDNYVHAVGSWDAGSSSGCGCNQSYSGGGYSGSYQSYSGGGYSGNYQERPGILGRIQSRLSELANFLPFRHQAEEQEYYHGEGTIMSSSTPTLAMPSRSSEPPLAAEGGDPSAPRAPVTPAVNFHPEPESSHGLLIEPEPN